MDNIFAEFANEDKVMNSDADFLKLGEQSVETDTPVDSQTENNEDTEETPSQEGEEEKQDSSEKTPVVHEDAVPYDRFKDVIDDKNYYKSKLDEALNLVSQLQSRKEETTANTEIPEWFSGIYGNDENAYQNYVEKERRSIIEQAKQEIINEQRQQIQAQQEATQRWEKYSRESMDGLQSQGKSFDRNELQKFIIDFHGKYGTFPALTPDGSVDFGKSLELMDSLKPKTEPQKSKARKEIADTSETTRNVSETRTKSRPIGWSRNVSPYDLARDDFEI